jgi:aminoglycoside phosphotransferase (APT) family kinase protein
MTVVPTSADEITTDRLTALLDRRVEVVAVERIGAEYGFAGEVYRVEVRSGTDLAVKLWDTTTAAGDRELHFCESFSERAGIPLPRFHAGHADRDRAVLVTDAIDVARQGDVMVAEGTGSLSAIAATLGTLHGRFWDRTDAGALWLRDFRELRPADWFAERRPEFIERFGEFEPGLARKVFDRVPATLERIAERWWDAPPTVVHGDLHLDNVVFDTDGRPIILDWASCGRGPGVIDLAEVLFGMAEPSQRDAVIGSYVDALRSQERVVSDGDLIMWLGGALLRWFLFHTYGAARWIPHNDRQERMQRHDLEQVQRSLEEWREIDPGLFGYLEQASR